MRRQTPELRVFSAQLTLITSNVPGLVHSLAAVRQLPQRHPVSSGSVLQRICVGNSFVPDVLLTRLTSARTQSVCPL